MGSTAPLIGEHLEVWQWNCRGFRRKRSLLQQYINTHLARPDVIALQEPGTPPIFSGYESYNSQTKGKAAILIDKALTAVGLDNIPDTNIEHVIVELVLRQKKKGEKRSIIIVNVYSAPKQKNTDFHALVQGACRLAQGKELLLLGDFNALDERWGYNRSDVKGKQLAAATEKFQLELLTDPAFPTRIGNSVCRDTCPDLTFARGRANYNWDNLQESLGSDHFILRTKVTESAARRSIGEARITNWDAFRRESEYSLDSLTSLTDWCTQLKEIRERWTTTINRTPALPEVDGHLLHLWEARRSLIRRWRTQKHNRRLKLRIATLTTQAEQYATELARLNWAQFSDSLRGSLGTARTWHILRALMDPTRTKNETNKSVMRLIHAFEGTDDELLDQVRRKCFGDFYPPASQAAYRGRANDTLDRPITVDEVYAAIRSSNRNTAAGADGITYSLIRNLNDSAVQEITAFFNDHWQRGTLPPEWKHAEVIMIPKPGKKLQIENLRPISLTSCLGKLFERVITNRVQDYLEDNDLFPHSMYGFRAHLSTQDVLLQLKEVIDNAPQQGENIILTLDIKGAFDNVSHQAILEGLEALHCGQRVYSYVHAFLSDRTATVGLGSIRSDVIKVPNKGTPQGSVISPLLFNVAMVGLAHELHRIDGIHHAMYADDITVWATRGSLGEKEYNLQQAATCVEQYAQARGLACATEKSELLRIYRRKLPPSTQNNQGSRLQVVLAGKQIPEKSTIRILGMWVQSNRHVNHTLSLLRTTTLQVARMISRVATRRHGMREEDTLKLIRSLVVSRVTYSLPYQRLTKSEQGQVDAMLRKAYKAALKLPPGTPSSKLLALGLHNTFEELCEAQLATQLQRLKQTPTGRDLLLRLGYISQFHDAARRKPIPDQLRATYKVAPIPRNMDPRLHQGRREARVEALERTYAHKNTTYYVDAANYDHANNKAVATVVDHTLTERTSASVRCRNITDAEETAIALALALGYRQRRSLTVLTDSQAACRNYLQGRISQPALSVIMSVTDTGEHSITHPLRIWHRIIWTPGHMGLEGNQAADRVARGYASRAPSNSAPEELVPVPCDYSAILNHYRGLRKAYSLPHRTLNKEESVSWRQIQTGTFPNLHILSKMHPSAYSPLCPWCSAKATLYHVTWECQAITALQPVQNPTAERWEELLASENLEDQLSLINRARRAAAASGALD